MKFMPGCGRDIDDVLSLFQSALDLMPTWRSSTLENRVLKERGFIERLKKGRVTPRKMAHAAALLRKFIREKKA